MLKYGERRDFSDRFEGWAITATAALGQVCIEAIACCVLGDKLRPNFSSTSFVFRSTDLTVTEATGTNGRS